MTPEAYLRDPRPSCPVCREPSDDVRTRFDHYAHACGADADASWRDMCGSCAKRRKEES